VLFFGVESYRKIKKKNNKKKQVGFFLAKLKNNVYICGVRKKLLVSNYGIINAGIK
jgi:hypothetical protein